MRAAALLLATLAGVCAASVTEPAWRQGVVYEYVVTTHTLVGLQPPPSHVTGILTRATLRLQLDAGDARQLNAQVKTTRFARVRKSSTGDAAWETSDSEGALRWVPLPLRRPIFALRLDGGKIQEFLLESDVSLRDSNYLRGVASALQLSVGSLSGGKLNFTGAFFPVNEESPMGKCLTRYDVSPLPAYVVQADPDLVPAADLSRQTTFMEITKTIDFDHCVEPVSYEWSPGGTGTLSGNGPVMRSATSRAIVAGHLDHFQLHTVVATSRVAAGTFLRDTGRQSVAWGLVNITLVSVTESSSQEVAPPVRPRSVSLIAVTNGEAFEEARAAFVHEQAEPYGPRDNRPIFPRSASPNAHAQDSERSREYDCIYNPPPFTFQYNPCAFYHVILGRNKSGIPEESARPNNEHGINSPENVHQPEQRSGSDLAAGHHFNIFWSKRMASPNSESERPINRPEQRSESDLAPGLPLNIFWPRRMASNSESERPVKRLAEPRSLFLYVYNYFHRNTPAYARHGQIDANWDDFIKITNNVKSKQTQRASEEPTLSQDKPTTQVSSVELLWRRALDNEAKSALAHDPEFAGVGDRCPEGEILAAARQLALEMRRPGELVRRGTLRRFSELTRVVRGCTFASLERITVALEHRADQEQFSAWKAFRDATVAAGTGPSLAALRSWLDSGLVSGWEARQLVATVRSATRNPSPVFLRYFQTRFVEDAAVRQLDGVGAAAAMAFASLVFDAHARGQPVVPLVAALTRLLRAAVDAGDALRTQVYARALGMTGHPIALQALSPFLRGVVPGSTIFLRTSIVVAVQRVAVLHPKLTRQVLYAIYQNEAEAYEVRVAAVYILIGTNPPLDMLQRMAATAHLDPSSQVSAAVRTSLQSAARLTHPKMRTLARNARSVLSVLMRRTQSLHYSRSVLKDYFVYGARGMGYSLAFNYIGSHDQIWPKMVYFGVDGYLGDLRIGSSKYAAMVSSVSKFLEVYNGDPIKDEYAEPKVDSSGYVNLGPRVDEPLEGHLYFPLPGGNQFVNLNKKTMLTSLWSLVEESLHYIYGKQIHNSKFYYGARYSYSVPDITGHQNFFTVDEISLMRSVGEVALTSDTINAKVSGDHIEETALTGLHFQMDMEYANTVASRMGFVCLYDEEPQRYVVAFDKEYQYNLPINATSGLVNDNDANVQYAIYLHSSDHAQKTLVHFKTSPYTARQLTSAQGPGDERDLQPIKARKESQRIVDFGPNGGFRFNITSEAEFFDEAQHNIDLAGYDFWSLMFLPIVHIDTQTAETIITFDPHKAEMESVLINMRYKGDEEAMPLTASNVGPQTPLQRSQDGFDAGHRKQNMELGVYVSHSNNKINAHILRGEYQTDFTRRNETFALHYISRESYRNDGTPPPDGRDFKHQLHLSVDAKWGDSPRWLFHEALSSDPTSHITSKLTYVDPEQRIMEIDVECKLRRSPEREAFLRRDSTARLCRDQEERGDLLLPACANVTLRAGYLDRYRCDAHYERLAPGFVNLTAAAYEALRQRFAPHVDQNPLHEGQRGRASLEVRFEPSFHGVGVALRTPSFAADFVNLRMTRLGRPFVTAHPRYSMGQRVEQYLLVYQNEPKCVLDRNKVNTFDNSTYNVHLGQCWHNISILNLMEETRQNLTIQARDSAEHRTLRVLLPQGIKMEIRPFAPDTTGRESSCTGTLYINGKSQTVSCDSPLPLALQNGDSYDIAEVTLITDNLFLVNLKRHGVRILYDGTRVVVYAPNRLRAQSRGLCGTFTGEYVSDFKDADGYVQAEPRLFAASYADVQEDCEGPAKDDHALYKKAPRFLENILLTDVVNRDGQAHSKPPAENCVAHRVDVIRNGTSLCFSQQKLLWCAGNCRPSVFAINFVKYHCISGSAGLYWKSIVDKGASPDFSHKPANTFREKEVPVSCTPS